MTDLPQNRRIISGRTFSQSWTPEHYDPIRHYRSTTPTWRMVLYTILACIAIGAVAAMGFRP